MTSLPQKIKVAFVNTPHADWILPNCMTYMLMKSHYDRVGKYADRIEWLEPPYRYSFYKTARDVYDEIAGADIYLLSSYIWNYDICDAVARIAKEENPNCVCILGGPHIGTEEPEYIKTRDCYDYICRPTKPGEAFIEDFLNAYVENGPPHPSEISWEIRSDKKQDCGLPQYSVYEDHLELLTKMVDHARTNKIEPFIVLETTRGCPYQCVFCEWGGGTGVKINKKDIDLVKRDILAIKKAGFRDSYLNDANFGAFFERDLEIFRCAWEHGFKLTDISAMKATNYERRKKLVDAWFDIVGPNIDLSINKELKDGTNMWLETEVISVVPTVSIQSISDEAMKVCKRVDLKSEDKIRLAKHIGMRCQEQGYPKPNLELILGMPGSTIDDFYKEMELVNEFKTWASYRHDYMFLPDSELSNREYQETYQVKTVEVFTDIIDEYGVDNWEGLYKNRQSKFRTIRSCYSFNEEEMKEMWIMNHAGNYLLEHLYPIFEEELSPGEFCKICFSAMQTCPTWSLIWNEVSDIFDPNTPPRSIKRLLGNVRTNTVHDFLAAYKSIIINYVYNKLSKSEKVDERHYAIS